MSRNLHANTLAVIGNENLQMFYLVTFEFGSPFRLTTHSHDIVYNFGSGDETFTSSGRITSSGDVLETIAISNPTINLTLTGANSADISLALTENFNDRQVIIRRGFYDTSGATTDANIIADPFEIFNGRVDTYSIDDDPTSGESNVTWSISSHFADWEKVSGRKCTNTSAKQTFPSEEGFSHVFDQIGGAVWGSVRS